MQSCLSLLHLCQAGESDHALAQTIAQKHQGIYDSTVYVMDGIYNNYTSFFPSAIGPDLRQNFVAVSMQA